MKRFDVGRVVWDRPRRFDGNVDIAVGAHIASSGAAEEIRRSDVGELLHNSGDRGFDIRGNGTLLIEKAANDGNEYVVGVQPV